MSFEALLEAKVIYYVISNAVWSHRPARETVQSYEQGRQWLLATTGKELPKWQKAVIQHEKQLSNR